jgi:hypothetical protein
MPLLGKIKGTAVYNRITCICILKQTTSSYVLLLLHISVYLSIFDKFLFWTGAVFE